MTLITPVDYFLYKNADVVLDERKIYENLINNCKFPCLWSTTGKHVLSRNSYTFCIECGKCVCYENDNDDNDEKKCEHMNKIQNLIISNINKIPLFFKKNHNSELCPICLDKTFILLQDQRSNHISNMKYCKNCDTVWSLKTIKRYSNFRSEGCIIPGPCKKDLNSHRLNGKSLICEKCLLCLCGCKKYYKSFPEKNNCKEINSFRRNLTRFD